MSTKDIENHLHGMFPLADICIIEETVASSLTPEEAVDNILSNSSITNEEGIVLYILLSFYSKKTHLLQWKTVL